MGREEDEEEEEAAEEAEEAVEGRWGGVSKDMAPDSCAERE